MRRFLSLFVGLLVVGIVGITLMALPTARAAPGTWPAGRGLLKDVSPCVPEFDKVVGPKYLLLGEAVDITLTVRALCAGERVPVHIVFVLDGSDSMAGQPLQQMRQVATRLVRSLDLQTYRSTQVGVVEFNTVARTRCRLTDNTTQAVSCIGRVQAAGGTAIDAGIREGSRVLRRGREGRDADEITEVMVVLSDGGNDAGCVPVFLAAGEARSQGILVIAACAGSACDETCMRRVASSPRYFFRAESSGGLEEIFEQIRDRSSNIAIRKLEVRDVLPANMAYVAESANPPQSEPSDPVDYLLWEDEYIPRDGVTYTFRAKPMQAGTWPTNLSATGMLTDNKGRVREWTFESPWVTVLQPVPLPTLATHTPTITPAPTATGTPAPRRGALYLAIVRTE